MTKWTAHDIPPQQGRTAIVTGTGGLGLADALELTRAGAHVILAGRDPSKGEQAIAKVRRDVSGASIRFEKIDLANLSSVASFSARLSDQCDRVDLLINNAGVMVPPKRIETIDGFELQFATNYLGHFALAAHLLPLLRKGRDTRVVSLSSVAARGGQIDFANLNAEIGYQPMQAYSQSKLACLMFALEFQRLSDAAGWGVTSIAAHPGVARTDLLHNAPGQRSVMGVTRSLLWFLFQPVEQGALPTLFAATSPLAKGGEYYGPDRLGETRGYPTSARIPAQALDRPIAARLWKESEGLALVSFR